MEPSFWQSKWQSGKTSFHKSEVNPKLANYLPALALARGSRIFVPLCGKSYDIGWLARQGYDVVGAELYEPAIQSLFAELELIPNITQHRDTIHYQADYNDQTIDIWVGNIFDLTARQLGHVDAIYDRAALVALSDSPPNYLRSSYVKQLISLTDGAKQLLVTFVFDQETRPGPPFIITPEQIQLYYGQDYQIEPLEDIYADPLLGDGTPGRSMVWLLS